MDLPRFRGEVSIWDQERVWEQCVLLLLLSGSLFWFGREHLFIPACTHVEPSRAGAVKVGRRANLASHCDISRPYLAGPEHGGRIVCAGIEAPFCLLPLEVDGR